MPTSPARVVMPTRMPETQKQNNKRAKSLLKPDNGFNGWS
jgi:hypothetical protein